VHVILNYHEYSVLVLTHSLTEDEQNVLDHYQEYGFVKLFTYYAKTKTVCDKIARMFVDETSTISPVTVGIINKQLELASQYVVLFGLVDDTECTDFDTEERRIIEFIQENYVIDHTIEHRMKASAIFTICTGFLQQADQNEVNMRKRISTYLKKMNLQKKRYNDGYYYYGIREKTAEEMYSNIKKDIPSDTTYHPEI
jgi:adenylate kinase family enzyme